MIYKAIIAEHFTGKGSKAKKQKLYANWKICGMNMALHLAGVNTAGLTKQTENALYLRLIEKQILAAEYKDTEIERDGTLLCAVAEYYEL